MHQADRTRSKPNDADHVFQSPRIFFMLLAVGSLLLNCSVQDKKNTDLAADEALKSVEDFENRPIYKTLTPEILSKIKDDELEQAIVDNIYAGMEDDEREDGEIIQSLTPGQRAIYVTNMIEGEVNNGGFNQLYYNTKMQFAGVGEEAFQTIGATQYAELLKEANLLYGKIKEDLEKYEDGTMESFSESYENNPLNGLDDKFFKLEEGEILPQLKIKYIRDHVSDFVTH